MNEKTKQILELYEDILLENLTKYKNGEETNTKAIQELNDCIRILHHIDTMRRLSI